MTKKITKLLIVTDWAGVLVIAMLQVLGFALGCFKRHLGVVLTKDEIEEKLIIFREFPFKDALKKAFPQADEKLIAACADDFDENLIAMVGPKVETIAGVKETLQTLQVLGKIEPLKVIISSAAPRKLVDWCAQKEGLMPYIKEIYCIEQGNKSEHLKQIRAKYPDWEIIFVSDSPSEMNLGDVSVGVAPQGQEMKYFDSGASSVIHSFPEILERNIRAI